MEENWSVHYRFLPWYESFYSDLSRLRDGGVAGAMNDTLSSFGLELHSRKIAGCAKVCWVVGIHHHDYLFPGFLSILDFKLRWVNAVQALLNDWLEGGRRMLVYSMWKSCVRHGWGISPEEPSEASIPSYAVVVPAVVLLSLVYYYLAGNVDRGGSKAYSRSSLDFRDIYVAIVLFLGAYVWIKFREAALRGAYQRKLKNQEGQIIKVVYEARLKPPMWNGKKVRRLDLGQFATQQEAHNKFLIAAFYYNRDAGLLNGWYRVPHMSEEQRSLTGKKKRKWVIGQAKKVYEDFKRRQKRRQKRGQKEKEKAEAEAALLLQALFEPLIVQATPGHDELSVDFSMSSLLNSAEPPQQPALVSQAENSGMSMARSGDYHGLECPSHSCDGMHEGLALANAYNLGCQEGFALPVSQVSPNTEIGMSLTGNDPLDLLQTRVVTLEQQVCDQQQHIYLQQWQIQEFAAQILELQQQQQRIQQQQLQEYRIQNPQWPCQFCFQQQQVQVLNQGIPNFEVWMEQSMHQQIYSGLTTPPPDGGED